MGNPMSTSPCSFAFERLERVGFTARSTRGEVSKDETVIADTGKLGRRPQITLGSDACTFLKGAVTQSWETDFKHSDCAISLPS